MFFRVITPAKFFIFSAISMCIACGSAIDTKSTTTEHTNPIIKPTDLIGVSRVYPLSASAATSLFGSIPMAMIDGDDSTAWNSGNFAPQAAQIQLQNPVTLRKIRFNPGQTPDGYTVHEIWGGLAADSLKKIGSTQGNTQNGVPFEWIAPKDIPNIKLIEIRTITSPSWVGWREIQIYSAGIAPLCDQVTKSSLDNFGYFASSFSNVGKGDYSDEVSDHSNILWTRAETDSISQKLNHTRAVGMKAIAVLENWVFFDDNMNLRTDYQTRWNDYADQIRPYIIDGTVKAIYPVDEPYLQASTAGTSISAMKVTLDKVISTIRGSFPNTPIAVIFSYLELIDSQVLIPTGYNWVGFDCYSDSFYQCNGSAPLHYLDVLKSKKTTSQKIILVPFGSVAKAPVDSVPTADDDLRISDAVDGYIQWSITDPEIIGMYPFLWEDNYDGLNYYHGTNGLPNLRAKFTALGSCLK